MIALDLTAKQQEAVQAPFDACFAIVGAAGTGKSTALAQRRRRGGELAPHAQPLEVATQRALEEYAAHVLRENGREIELIDDAAAEQLFTQACAPLFELEWEEFAAEQLDPEVPGLRSPERFLQSAFRLIRRLGDAGIDPQRLRSISLRGTTEFYANPPNFADSSLLVATKSVYHDSLDVAARELEHQRRREVDLTKILARLYEDYLRLVDEGGRMTGRDAIRAATLLLRENGALAAQLRERHRLAFVDDAQELSEAAVGLLRAIFGDTLAGVTLCGDAASAVSLERRTQPEATFALAAARATLREPLRRAPVNTARTSTAADEAALIASQVVEWIASGVRPEEIAVLFRSVRNVELYEEALLDRNVAVVIEGDVNPFADRRALDALALLWNVWDPFRHEWMLRTLSGSLALSDASLAALCAEPADPQRPLFAFDDEPAPTTRASRWNPKRDLRLGWNVVRGECDAELSAEAAERLQRFRALRERWIAAMHERPFDAFARAVWRDALPRDGTPGSARAAAQQVVLSRLLDGLRAFATESPNATAGDILEYATQRAQSDPSTALRMTTGLRMTGVGVATVGEGFVRIMSVEAALGLEFDRVVVGNVRPGAFPLWYSPDNFLFSPRYGMIPKENAGEARASRTAKFTYYMYRSKAAQHYNERERRAFQYALKRARRGTLATAWGTPTRGVTAPELLEELRA
ncbi:MAG TPA: UvrD-helicase domain-containing protein [Candidatus Cybelea sp.]|jgi:superfamily I DNA/RNA helicase|nr:UvrD-helicase domain-containing protein [Candidatus Cybelea sp.]